MNQRTKTNYRKIWEEYNSKVIPAGNHIHHIDGDRNNNSPENLLCVTPKEHWEIHYNQGDPVALNGKFIQGASEAGKKGGAVGKGKTISDEQKIKMSISMKLKYKECGSWNKDRERSDETKQKISKATSGENNPRYGKEVTKETRAKISETKKRKFSSGELIPHSTKHTKETRKKMSEYKLNFFENGGKSPFASIYDVIDENGECLCTDALRSDVEQYLQLTEREFLSLYAYSKRTDKIHPKSKLKIISKGKYYDAR